MKLFHTTALVLASTFTINTAFAAETCSSVALLETSVTELSDTINTSQTTTLQLSTDIGTMADRIGTMADRIVATENLLAETLVTLTGSSNSSTPTVLLTAPLDNASVAAATAPTITLSPASNRYLLLASNSALFPDNDTVSLLIDTSNNSLTTAWSLITGSVAQNSTIFIAVRSLDASDQQSDRSNSIQLNIQ